MLSRLRQSRELDFRIEVDGGIHQDTVADVVRAGAQILVAGSAVFEHDTPRETARQLLACARIAIHHLCWGFSSGSGHASVKNNATAIIKGLHLLFSDRLVHLSQRVSSP